MKLSLCILGIVAAAAFGEAAACSAFQPSGPLPPPAVTCVVTLDQAPDGSTRLAPTGTLTR